ncbi:MAG: hypothetical protein CMO74_12235 [Verrucomicrobiales bacterium]|nr:hypothetical protein [Verrucomicrobiales bacterium]
MIASIFFIWFLPPAFSANSAEPTGKPSQQTSKLARRPKAAMMPTASIMLMDLKNDLIRLVFSFLAQNKIQQSGHFQCFY